MAHTVRDSLFISYSHKDEKWLNSFCTTLKPVEQTVKIWDDTQIQAGSDRLDEVKNALQQARAALLLVTENFLASEFITNEELPKILKNAQDEGLSIYWVLIRDCLWQETELADIQSCYPNERPLQQLKANERQKAICQICNEIVAKMGQYTKIDEAQRKDFLTLVQDSIEDRCIVEDEISSGDFSIVYQAVQGKRKAAVKAFSPVRDWMLEHFDRGAQAAMQLKHPSFITIYDSILQREPHCVIMEYIEGKTLDRLLETSGPLPVDHVLVLIQQLAEALVEAHDYGLLHGHLQPSNIFIEKRPLRARISAFRFSNTIEQLQHMSGNFQINREALSYMTPEHYYGRPPSPQTDQYALGLIAFDMLQGETPAKVTCPADLCKRQEFFENPQAYADAWHENFPKLAEIIFTMLAEKPEQRWSSLGKAITKLGELRQINNEQYVSIAKQSYLQHCQDRSDFYQIFYHKLFEVCPDTRSLFENIPMERQYQSLDSAIKLLLNFSIMPVSEPTVLTDIVEQHRQLHLNATHFEQFARMFIETLKSRDEDKQVLHAWETVIWSGVDYMKKHLVDD